MENENKSIMDDIERLLETADVKPSPVRILVGRVLLAEDRPLSALEIDERLLTVDRSSITRTLAIFTEHGMVHTIDDGSGSTKYELCRDRHEESDMHPHFHCTVCGSTYCLTDSRMPELPSLPAGFRAEKVNFVVKGRCPRCS